jgi:hypothetical protein
MTHSHVPVRALLLGALAVVAALVVGVVPLSPAGASTGWSLSTPLARETVRPGARDLDVHHVAHVREVQLRLARLGLYRRAIDGIFGSGTGRAVRAFQHRAGLRVTGDVGHRTWARLIARTTHLRVPASCLAPGWHMCVDRRHHEATLFDRGQLYNSWLVRTGAWDMKTRIGTHRVYWRDIDHYSHEYGGAMPYSQFFDGGQALHGSVLMTNPFEGHSHGCVNFYLEDARQLWRLTSTRRLVVTVHGAWD